MDSSGIEMPDIRRVIFVCVFQGSIIKHEAEKRERPLVLAELGGLQHVFDS